MAQTQHPRLCQCGHTFAAHQNDAELMCVAPVGNDFCKCRGFTAAAKDPARNAHGDVPLAIEIDRALHERQTERLAVSEAAFLALRVDHDANQKTLDKLCLLLGAEHYGEIEALVRALLKPEPTT